MSRNQSRIPKSKLPEALEALRAMGAKELDDLSAIDAIRNLRRQIERVLKLGYTYDEISQTLAKLDVNISGQRIKYFMGVLRAESRKKSQSKLNQNQTKDNSVVPEKLTRHSDE